MGISQGNLNYHFKKREDVIEALYFRLVADIDGHMVPKKEEGILQTLRGMSRGVMLALYGYRFILLDFVQLMRENEKIRKHFIELQGLREQQFLMIFKMLNEAGLMRGEVLNDEFKNLGCRLQILGDFWISSAEISEDSLTKKSLAKYATIIDQTIFPYLTEKGKIAYKQVMSN